MWREVKVNSLTSVEQIPIIAEIEREVFGDLAWTEEMLRGELRNTFSANLIIRGDSEIIGYLLYRVIGEEAEILRFAIRPSFQRRGFGSHLFRNFLNFVKEKSVKKIFLEVAESNFQALRFYKRWGFHLLMERENYYKPGEKALILVLNL